ncbi:MAG: amidase [SAR202 cluster bacterium]|nr:amidase [SAR202 cluster bacterium]|tara:strand:+ start:39544 stop:40926 length:1383 start_codon:yes stop_codon:yes gene_type:complete
MNQDITSYDLNKLSKLIKNKIISPNELLDEYLKNISSKNKQINAIVTISENAKSDAKQAENEICNGKYLGPFHGIPFTIKDCIDTKNLTTTRGSNIFSEYVPKTDSTVVKRLKKAGGILLGKTNLPEFAFSWETNNIIFGKTNHPNNFLLTPGGSSGGEAAAIASNFSPIGVGSDLGGSVREPANYCGLIGFKPSHGLIPLTGHWPEMLLRFQHIGPIAKSVKDIDTFMINISGPDQFDQYSLGKPRYQSYINSKFKKLKIAWCNDGPFIPIDPQIQDTIAKAANYIKNCGHSSTKVSLDSLQKFNPLEISKIVYTVESQLYFKKIVSNKINLLSKQISERLDTPIPNLNDYIKSINQIEKLRSWFTKFFSEYDILLCPTGPVTAHPHEAQNLNVNGKLIHPRNALRDTVPFNLTGLPALTIPFNLHTNSLPIGVQIIGGYMNDTTVLKTAEILESHTKI